MKIAVLPLLLLGAGCTTAVYNPDKSRTDMKADIAMCEREANRLHYWDRVAALQFAYDCLAAKGYSREQSAIIEGAKEPRQDGRSKPEPGQPCRVPC